MHEEQTVEAVRWRMVAELGKARDAAEANLRRTHDLAERAEEAIREDNRRAVGEWARKALGDSETVVMALGTTGLRDPVDVVEVVALGVDGETVISERVRPAKFEAEAIVGHDDAGDPMMEKRETGPVEVEEGAASMHSHTAESLAGARTFSELYPELRDALGDKRLVVYNAEYVERVLSQAIARYDLEPLGSLAGIECAMAHYSRLEGTWSVEDESYYNVPLPHRDGTPRGNACATWALLQRLAIQAREEDWDSVPF